jgi:hypothetical protein
VRAVPNYQNNLSKKEVILMHIRRSIIPIVLLLFLVCAIAVLFFNGSKRVFARPGTTAENPQQDLGQSAITQVITRTVSTNAGAFMYESGSPDIVMSADYGLTWAAGSSERAGFYLQRPADWEGQTPVVATITFALGGSQAGTVNWTLRLNSYTPGSGEWLTNPASRDADAILTFTDGPSWLRIYSQAFTIPAEDFNQEPYWSFFFVRGDGSNGETFPGNLYVMGADIEYQALLPVGYLYLPLIVR